MANISKWVDRSLIDMEALNDWQKAAIVLLATKREHKMGYDQMAKELGITSVTLYRFRQRRDVKQYLLDYQMQRIIDKIPEILDKQVDMAVSRGNVKSAELLLKYAGLLIERREVQTEENVNVTHSIDQRDTLELESELHDLRKRAERLKQIEKSDVVIDVSE